MSLRPALHGGGLAAWSIRHPIGVTMIALAAVVLGLFAMGRLAVDLLPHLIYPEVRVRILDPGVPAGIMEDRVTRQLEEQLAITEGAIAVQSSSTEGAVSVDLSFAYGSDIDLALRDASTRLDRAKRFLPETIEPPVIYKRDPSQIPVVEFVVSAADMAPVKLRDWIDYDFSKQFLNLPGVAAVEVGGGVLREILIEPDQQRLAALGIQTDELIDTLVRANQETPAGRLTTAQREINTRTAARFESIQALRDFPVRLPGGGTVALEELARISDGHDDERIKIRLDELPGVKVSVQKQPNANTVEVVDAVQQRFAQLQQQRVIPDDVTIRTVSDQSIYVRSALNNATLAALSGTVLAMLVVFLFLGDLRRTFIVGSAIPLAVLVTFAIMALGGLTFNIMTLGGLALGVGMLVDNTIVMLENIQRHQQAGEQGATAGTAAAREINSAIVAATSTNLAAILPFLFIGGLVGLLFRELIFTISAAILASMVVALTLVPTWAVRLKPGDGLAPIGRAMARLIARLQGGYRAVLAPLLNRWLAQLLLLVLLLGGLGFSVLQLGSAHETFLPAMDSGEISISLSTEPGTPLSEMDAHVRRIEQRLRSQPEVVSVFSVVGGSVFGRSARESADRSSITVQLIPRERREQSSDEWIAAMQKKLAREAIAGLKVNMRTRGIRGIRMGGGDDDLTLRLQGPDLEVLQQLGDKLVATLSGVPGVRNLQHSAEELRQELSVRIDRQRAATLGVDAQTLGRTLRLALEGETISDYLEGDRAYDIRLRLPHYEVDSSAALEQLILHDGQGRPLRLGEVAQVTLIAAPAEIRRDRQRRIVEVSGSLSGELSFGEVYRAVRARTAEFALPDGYTLYEGGEYETLQQGTRASQILLGLALFLVFVVMAVQYESLRNPLVILLGVPFAVIGVGLGLTVNELPLSMPVWLGMIMLAGIVVNNAIILVEYFDLARAAGATLEAAILEGAQLRLRPILMTTLSTVCGMLPLALGWGEGAEMLQPLAITLIYGLGISLLVTLLLIPLLYRAVHRLLRGEALR
ncbi:MAG: efflux RND transporter permease subunit [Gammaproteobacteria bacterium]|nr:efflux RND transporter permease subunit [Gammaproteobacteria bacterium]